MNYLTLVEDLEESTARKYIKNTKELFEIATARKWIPSNPWSGFTIKQDNKDREILSMIDIYALHNHKFTGRLDWVRDCALFGIFTGYAFCELDNFQKTDIFLGNDGSRWIKIDRKKTGKPELMPLLPIPAAIVDKYWEDPYCVANGKLLPLRSYQKFNGYLKELAGICQLSSEPTPHILRHTFATTICLDNGVSMETVMRLLGHTNIRTTQIYAKVTRKKLSEDMGDLQKKLFKFDGSLVKMEDDVMKLIAKHVEKMAS
jgi:site-specific recombinase XerD